MPDPRSHRALAVAERVADGLADGVEWERANASLGGVQYDHTSWALMFDPYIAAERGAAYTSYAVASATKPTRRQQAREAESAAQVELLRDLVGNPFRPVVPDPAWLTSDVVALARGIYDERAFDRMPILADALEDAGCADEQVLGHCRGPGPHVRGCWAVDLVLGQE